MPEQSVVAGAASQLVVAIAAEESIVAAATDQHVVTAQAADVIITSEAADDVVTRRPSEVIIAAGSHNRALGLVGIDDVDREQRVPVPIPRRSSGRESARG